MEKFNLEKDKYILNNLPFSYFTTQIYADYSCYVFERNGERLLVWQDILYPHEFPCVFPPSQESNFERCSITFADDVFCKKVEKEFEVLLKKSSGSEFFYETSHFTEPSGSISKDVKLFTKNYQFTTANECDINLVKDFYHKWKTQKERENISFEDSEEFFFFCLDNLDKYKVKQVYVFVDGKLVGLAWGVEHSEDKWVGLHLKLLYEYKGLGRFLHNQRALLFSSYKDFTLGTGANDKGIEDFKHTLGPVSILDYFYILMGERKR